MNTIIPEKTQLAGLPQRSLLSLHMWKGLSYSTFYCIHLKYYSVFLLPD